MLYIAKITQPGFSLKVNKAGRKLAGLDDVQTPLQCGGRPARHAMDALVMFYGKFPLGDVATCGGCLVPGYTVTDTLVAYTTDKRDMVLLFQGGGEDTSYYLAMIGGRDRLQMAVDCVNKVLNIVIASLKQSVILCHSTGLVRGEFTEYLGAVSDPALTHLPWIGAEEIADVVNASFTREDFAEFFKQVDCVEGESLETTMTRHLHECIRRSGRLGVTSRVLETLQLSDITVFNQSPDGVRTQICGIFVSAWMALGKTTDAILKSAIVQDEKATWVLSHRVNGFSIDQEIHDEQKWRGYGNSEPSVVDADDTVTPYHADYDISSTYWQVMPHLPLNNTSDKE